MNLKKAFIVSYERFDNMINQMLEVNDRFHQMFRVNFSFEYAQLKQALLSLYNNEYIIFINSSQACWTSISYWCHSSPQQPSSICSTSNTPSVIARPSPKSQAENYQNKKHPSKAPSNPPQNRRSSIYWLTLRFLIFVLPGEAKIN